MNLGEILNHEARSLELEFDGASEPDMTYGTIRRKRAVRQGATAGVAAVGIGALAFGGFRLAQMDHVDPTPATSVGVDGTVSIDVTDASALDPFAATAQCGEAAPVPTDVVDGLELVDRTSDPVVLNPVASDRLGTLPAAIVSSRLDSPVVSTSDVGFVWTQDGTVVAQSISPYWAYPSMNYAFGPIRADARTNILGYLGARTYRCDSPAGGPWTTLSAGTYQVYPVVRVVGSPISAGWSRLVAQGTVLVPGGTPDPGLFVNSDECVLHATQVASGEAVDMAIPRECLIGPEDPANPTVFTVHYSADEYTAALDALLVGEPLTVTLNTSWQEAAAIRDARAQATVVPSSLQCGTEIPGSADVVSAQLRLHPYINDGYGGLPEGPVEVGLVSERLTSPAAVTLADETRLWFRSLGDQSTGSSSRESDPIIGWATVRPATDAPLYLTANERYVWAPVEITDITLCDGAENQIVDAFLDGTVTWSDVEGTREMEIIPR